MLSSQLLQFLFTTFKNPSGILLVKLVQVSVEKTSLEKMKDERYTTKSVIMIANKLPANLTFVEVSKLSKVQQRALDSLKDIFRSEEFQYVKERYEFTDSSTWEFLTMIAQYYTKKDFLPLKHAIGKILSECECEEDCECFHEENEKIAQTIKNSGLDEIVKICKEILMLLKIY